MKGLEIKRFYIFLELKNVKELKKPQFCYVYELNHCLNRKN